jgi:hypothetical protein
MKKILLIIIVLLLIYSVWWFQPQKEKYTVAPKCPDGYILTCISKNIPGGENETTSNQCPDNFFSMCIPDIKYQLISVSPCPFGFDIHPETHKCAPLSVIKK